MANTSHTAFSQDGKYLAVCGTDGKLKIWETTTSRLKQEFVPNLHLSSPCSVLRWIVVSGQSRTPGLPEKKRRKKSINEDVEHKDIVAMGSTNGTVTLYDVSTSSISHQFKNGHSSSITALTWSYNAGLYTAAEDKQIIEWNLQEKSVKCKWKYGKGKVTSLAILSNGKSMLSGEKKIKWWDLETKKLICVIDGHAGQVNTMHCIQVTEQKSYLFSSAFSISSSDNYLQVWALDKTKKDSTSVAALTLPDEPLSFSVKLMPNSQIWVLSVTRSGDAQLFIYQPNGVTSKVIKPALIVQVAADVGQKESIQKIPIITAAQTEDGKMLLAYGSYLGLTIEKVVPDFSSGIQCLERIDLNKLKTKKDEVIMKVKQQETEGKIEYLSAVDTTIVATTLKRNKSGTGSQIPLKERLENLSLDAETSVPNKSIPKGTNMAQLLLQGLHSGDEKLLAQVFNNKKENVIKNTVARLPVQAIVPLLKKITSMLQGKFYMKSVANTWLKIVLLTHNATLMSLPNADEVFAPILSYIDGHSKNFIALQDANRYAQAATAILQHSRRDEKQEKNILEECLLVYEDKDSSDEEADITKVDSELDLDIETDTDSDSDQSELSDQEHMQEDLDNGKSDDEASSDSSD